MFIGLLICFFFSILATWLGGLQHWIGAPILGLLLGAVFSNLLPGDRKAHFADGMNFSAKKLLKVGIVLAGGTLSFQAVLGVGLSSLPIIIFNICLSFAVAFLVGRWLKVSPNTRTLVGGGTAICGSTAIATLTPIVRAKEDEMAYALTAIFLFDIFAAMLWPYAAEFLALSPEQYGILGGLAISDTSSVAAAGATYDALLGAGSMTLVNGDPISGGSIAVIIKLTRTVLLAAVALIVLLVTTLKAQKSEAGESKPSIGQSLLKAFPFFVLWFLLMAVVNTFVDFSSISLLGLNLGTLLKKGYKFLITMALFGVGFRINLSDLFKKGLRPVLLGGAAWLAVSASTILYIALLM